MSDSLRDRIAAALYRIFPPYQLGYSFGCPTEKWEDESERCKDIYCCDADAVIAELDLTLTDSGNSDIPQETEKGNKPNNLRDRIAAAIKQVDDMRVCKLSNADIKFIADAVIAELDWENRITSAICSYAGSEQMALSHHDPNKGGTEFDALTRLISEAPKIARYAMKYRRPDGVA